MFLFPQEGLVKGKILSSFLTSFLQHERLKVILGGDRVAQLQECSTDHVTNFGPSSWIG